MNDARPLRILHAPRDIAGQAGDIVAALRRLGHDAEHWSMGPDPFGRAADRVLDGAAGDAGAVWATINEAVARFDIVHFHFGQTLVPSSSELLPPYWDLPVYRALGLRVYFTFHGSEIRIGRIFNARNPWSHQFSGTSEPDDDRTEKRLHVMRTYADRMFVVSTNYLGYVPDAEYLPRVLDLARWPALAPTQRERPVILHAPTRRTTKGTDLILADLDALRAEGLDFELRLLEGVPHEEVRIRLADADILVDNLIAGSYGMVSVEAMACGRVAVANMSDAVRAAHPDVPVVHVDPTTLRDTLRRLILDRGERQRLAARGRPFVEAVHDADRIAERLVAAYTGPRQPPTRLTMPDWSSFAGVRRIEVLEARIDRMRADLKRSRRHEAELRERLGLRPANHVSTARRLAMRVVPARFRRHLRGFRTRH